MQRSAGAIPSCRGRPPRSTWGLNCMKIALEMSKCALRRPRAGCTICMAPGVAQLAAEDICESDDTPHPRYSTSMDVGRDEGPQVAPAYHTCNPIHCTPRTLHPPARLSSHLHACPRRPPKPYRSAAAACPPATEGPAGAHAECVRAPGPRCRGTALWRACASRSPGRRA